MVIAFVPLLIVHFGHEHESPRIPSSGGSGRSSNNEAIPVVDYGSSSTLGIQTRSSSKFHQNDGLDLEAIRPKFISHEQITVVAPASILPVSSPVQGSKTVAGQATTAGSAVSTSNANAQNDREERDRNGSTSSGSTSTSQPGRISSGANSLGGQNTASGARGSSQDNGSSHVHVIFSTDCSAFQNWQSVVLFYSARAAGQRGPLTRIASGCTAEEKSALRALHAALGSPQFRAHFTPDYSADPKHPGKRYLFFNKPHGLLHWLTHGSFNETIVALVDPDMLFLRPITGLFPASHYLTSSDWKKGEAWPRVERGKPAGQQYGLGSHWRSFNRKYICGVGSPCTTTTAQEAQKYFPVGPPYILHVLDLKALATEWVRMVPKIYEEYPQLLAEMYAYCMAAAHLNLRHFKVDHLMVSNVQAGGEGWPWVDSLVGSKDWALVKAGAVALARSTIPPLHGPAGTMTVSAARLPTVLHYCQNYRIGDWLFAKRRVPKGPSTSAKAHAASLWPPPQGSILSCAHPLLAEPVPSLEATDWYAHNDGSKKPLSKTARRRVFWVMSVATRGMNAALERFKRGVCPGLGEAPNMERSFRMVPEHVEKARLKAAKAKSKELM
eukprot:CAMPEP_0172653240 /NCGR_PEP_ID=MMETSP1068-20121228/243725_1 /TAXON_ID=35684 /ORGANISM="Pseudopedinella elastica, Strain CCMP716" /LENGTH=610 /DNA_ID=CAMNT_0013467669 /DNA_START=141 /DNA_END=1973 /DNA_ORIENTATION=-